MNTQDNQKSIIYILLGMSLFSIQDGLIKFVYNDTSLYELYFGRTFVCLCFYFLFLCGLKKKSLF